MPDGAPHLVSWKLTRSQWLATEWLGVAVHVFGAIVSLAWVAGLWSASWWWLLTVGPWWFFFGTKGVGLAWRVVVGPGRLVLRIDEDGTMFVAANDQLFFHGWWSGFESHPGRWVLVGGDGRYRVVIPRHALSTMDLQVIRDRVRVELERAVPSGWVKIPPPN